MSRDGVLPKRLSSIHPKFGTPFVATWVVGIVFSVFGALVPLGVLAELINIGTLAAFGLLSVAVVVVRKKRPDLPRAFLGPVVPALPVLFYVALMTFLSRNTWIAFGVWLLIGLAVYFGYSRRNSLLHPKQ
jgi:APA family basic amino acid/polyamine antiporter